MKLLALCIAVSVVFILWGLPNLTADHKAIEQAENNRTTAILKAITPVSHKVRITLEDCDDRGLTSVLFVQDGKEWGLDYLTKQQLDSFKAIK
jgi:hypothetical protein